VFIQRTHFKFFKVFSAHVRLSLSVRQEVEHCSGNRQAHPLNSDARRQEQQLGAFNE
jgi:hypothetical protein